MKYKKGMKVMTLEDCELPHDMRREVFTVNEIGYGEYNGVIKVRNLKGDLCCISKCYIDEKATKKLNQTKKDFNKKFKFDEINVELQFNQAYDTDTDIFINIVDFKGEIFTTITTKQAEKLIKHLQKMIDYVEE
jgi:hypothetical protein